MWEMAQTDKKHEKYKNSDEEAKEQWQMKEVAIIPIMNLDPWATHKSIKEHERTSELGIRGIELVQKSVISALQN